MKSFFNIPDDSIPQSENLALSLNSWNQNSREYDDTLRLLRKENFNLKLRIYFLEERFSKIQDNCSVLNNWDSEFNEQNMYQRNIDLEVCSECCSKFKLLLSYYI